MKSLFDNYLTTKGSVIILLIISGVFFQNTLKSQFYSGSQMNFGKNRIQYSDERTWNYFRFTNFDTYYYENGKSLAIYASSFAEKEIQRISKYLDFYLDDKVKFMVFNDLSDLKETNIGLLTDENYNIGGETYIIENKIFIYFNGNHKDFETQISKGIAQVFLNQIMYGGSIGSSMKNSALLYFPDWFSNGLISFLAEDWNTEIDAKVRDGFISGRYNDFKKINQEEQTLAGHSLWKYISEKYGRRALSDVLFLSKINRNIESGFVYVLGISYLNLIEDWKNYYSVKYNAEKSLNFTIPENPFFRNISRKKRLSEPNISADGRYLSYVENQIGKVKLKVVDLKTGKSKTIEKFGYKLDEKVDYTYPVVAWSSTTNFLTYVMEVKNDLVLVYYDMENNKKTKKFLNNFDKVQSMSYNLRGNLIVMSAVQKGQSDIYIYNVGANTFKRITYDIFDDEYPVFVNGGNGLIFASNRLDDTLRLDVETGKNIMIDTLQGRENRDIYFYDLSTNSLILRNVTATENADEKQPQYLAFNQFAWLSNQTGIYNRMIGKFDSTINYIDTIVHYKHIAKSQITNNYFYNTKAHHVSLAAKKIIEIIPSNGKDKIYISDLKAFDDFEKKEPVYTSFVLTEMYKESQRKKKELEEKAKKDTLNTTNKPKEVQENPAPSKKKFKVLFVGQSSDSTSIIDVNDYNPKTNQTQPVEAKAEPKQISEQLYRPKNYEVQFSVTELVSQMDFSYMNLSYQPFSNTATPIFQNQGFAAFMKFGVMDLLEDQRIVAGVKLGPTLSGNEYLFSYSNLKKRLDKEYTFHRMILTEVNEKGIIYDYVHEGFVKYNWPFDNVRSLRTTLSIRSDYQVQKSIDHLSLVEPEIITNRAGLKLEYVFDNTRNPALNIHFGTRYKIFAEYYQPINDLEENTYILGFDYRKYTKIAGNFIWANRIAGSTSFGSQRLIYYLGGVDNWMFPNFNRNIQIDQNQDFIYQTLATNLRGFTQNIRNGNSFLAINSELRLPPFTLLSRKPVKSDFLANFQIVGFFDVGTAWSGPNPFSDENSLFRQEFYQKPITVVIINQNDPIVAGYGFGLRSRIFGYFIRADWAWGIQNGYREDSIFYLSLSLDF
jgi:hypothetical protein